MNWRKLHQLLIKCFLKTLANDYEYVDISLYLVIDSNHKRNESGAVPEKTRKEINMIQENIDDKN